MKKLKDFLSWLDKGEAKCIMCGTKLSKQPVIIYQHPGGLEIEGMRYWAYIVCPRCKYQNAWWKLWRLWKT